MGETEKRGIGVREYRANGSTGLTDLTHQFLLKDMGRIRRVFLGNKSLRSRIFLAAVITFIFALIGATSVMAFSGLGSGSEEDPYVITNVDQLQEMNVGLPAYYYILDNDIDASETNPDDPDFDPSGIWGDEKGFEPVGTYDVTSPFTSFMGSLDGQGYKITDLYINRADTDYVGLFGSVFGGGVGGVVKNVGLENENVSGGDNVGGLVGYNYYNGTVSNSYSTGSVSGSDCVGGLVGYNDSNATVDNSYSTGSVSGTAFVGGLVGWNNAVPAGSYGTVSNSYSTGSVSGTDYVGGLVGYNRGTVSNSYSTGTVSGSGMYVGGLVGKNDGTVSNSFWDTVTSGQATSDGGTGKSTENMKNVGTYTDTTWSAGLTSAWDFVGDPYDDVGDEDIWDIDGVNNDGYPFLSWQVFTSGGGGGGINHHLSWYDLGITPHASWYHCAIATASYGTPMAEEVKTLSNFRDEYLLTNRAGQALVSTYHRLSPPVADFIRDKESLKAVVRTGLKPLVWVAEKATQ